MSKYIQNFPKNVASIKSNIQQVWDRLTPDQKQDQREEPNETQLLWRWYYVGTDLGAGYNPIHAASLVNQELKLPIFTCEADLFRIVASVDRKLEGITDAHIETMMRNILPEIMQK